VIATANTLLVRFGSLADISGPCGHVGFAPDNDQKSGHQLCRLCARSGPEQVQQIEALGAEVRDGEVAHSHFTK
jgi:hypothetical protein